MIHGFKNLNMREVNKMGVAKDNLERIIEKINNSSKAQKVFITNISGKEVHWNMTFQFNLDDEEPFYLEIKDSKVSLFDGSADDPEIILSGENEAIKRICEGQGDFTHAISREEITVEKGKVMDVIRLTRAINIVLR
jgi:putative sterol carrier protein